MLVAWVAHHKLPHPRSPRENLSRRTFVNEVEVGVHGLPRGRRAVDDLQIASDQRNESGEMLLCVTPRLDSHISV